jgi:hypothetical protein
LKNYPDHSFSMQNLSDSVLSQRRIHMSQSDQEKKEDNILSYMNENSCQGNFGQHLNDLFSKSVQNIYFEIGQEKENQIMAKISLKQLWEECCMEANGLGLKNGPIQLEDHLKSFLRHCNQTNEGSVNLGI